MKNYITFSILLIGAVLVNSFYLQAPFLGTVLALIYLAYYGAKLGRIILPKFDRFWAALFGPLFLLALVSLLGGALYYLSGLGNYSLTSLLIALPLLLGLAQSRKMAEPPSRDPALEKVEIVMPTVSPINRLALLVLLIDGLLFYYLFNHSTVEAIRSPWPLVSPNFFWLFALATFLLIFFLKNTRRTFFALCTIFVHSALMLSLALIIYKLGYGFDPFVHRAAEDYIAQFGAIAPQTPYYIGQYALIIFLHKLSLLPVGLIDKMLLPLVEALWLPPLVFLTLRQGLKLDGAAARLGALFFFIKPFSGLVATTPQDLANFYALGFILWGSLLITSELINIWPVIILALASLITHPLIGLPITLAAILLLLVHYSPKQNWLKLAKQLFTALLVASAVLILPTVFLLYANLKTGVSAPLLQTLLSALSRLPAAALAKAGLPALLSLPAPRPHFSPHLGWTLLYYYDYLFPLLYLIVSGWGAVAVAKNQRRLAVASAVIFIIFWLNILLLRAGVVFPDVISYEQNQYPDRLAQFSFYLLLPLFLSGLISVFNRLTKKHQLSAALLFAALLTVSFYLSYPRVDPFAFSRTFNVSAADFQAVEKIEELSGGKDYVVLSNQIMAAAALQKFGFKKYYPSPLYKGEGPLPSPGSIFYYALPTGGELYRYYQKMVYENPSAETAREVMNLTGVSEVYLAVNDYWNSFNFVAPLAKKAADEWWTIAGGKVIIFKYAR